MVAYSFRSIFEPQIRALLKRQTVRADRRRHARPGESVQLYVGMRTTSCRKILHRDPICTRVDEIEILVPARHGARFPEEPTQIGINGRPFSYLEIEAFARADGFGRIVVKEHGQWCGTELNAIDRFVAAETLMAAWWHEQHGPGPWRGVVIHWDPRS